MKNLGLITKGSAALMLAVGLVTACGGDGGHNLPKGQFVDSVVIGISYSTSSSKKGVTDANGKFSYRAGDTITFSIGDIVLPSGLTQDGIITPAHLAGNAEWETDVTAINIIQFLLSIDEDANADNGIQIHEGLAEFSEGIEFDFSDEGFDAELADFLLDVNGEFELDLVVIGEPEAIEHFTATLEQLDMEIEIEISEEEVACNSTNTADIQGTWIGTLTDTLGDPTYVGEQTITVASKNLSIGEADIGDSCTYQHTIVTEPVERITDTWAWTDGFDTYTIISTEDPAGITFTVAENNGFDVSSGTISQDK